MAAYLKDVMTLMKNLRNDDGMAMYQKTADGKNTCAKTNEKLMKRCKMIMEWQYIKRRKSTCAKTTKIMMEKIMMEK